MKDAISYSIIIGFLLIVAVTLCQGCVTRQAGHHIVLKDCHNCTVETLGQDIDAALDKAVRGELSPGRSIPVTVEGNTVPISGGSVPDVSALDTSAIIETLTAP